MRQPLNDQSEPANFHLGAYQLLHYDREECNEWEDSLAMTQPSNAHPPSSQRVLLTGGTGYVGSRMREAFREAGFTVRLLVRSAEDARDLRATGYEVANGDVTDPATLSQAIDQCDTVVNLVAVIRESGGATFEAINYQGSVNLIRAAQQSGAPRFIQMSANGAGNRPDFPYHYTKWRAENELKQSGLRYVIFRPSIIFGPSPEGRQHFISQLADVVRAPAPLVPQIGDGQTRFQPIHHQDVAESFLRAVVDDQLDGSTFEIGGPQVLTYRQILDEIRKVLGSRKPIVPAPVQLVKVGATVLDHIPGITSPVSTEQLKMLSIDNVAPQNDAVRLVDHPLIPVTGNLDYILKG